MKRREFTRNQREEIVERAKETGVLRCEGCGAALKPNAYEIDHIIAERLRPEADKARKITVADGQLLGKDCCHRAEGGKTAQDIAKIAQAKRRYDRANGLKKPKGSFPKPDKPLRVSRPSLPPRPMFRSVER